MQRKLHSRTSCPSMKREVRKSRSLFGYKPHMQLQAQTLPQKKQVPSPPFALSSIYISTRYIYNYICPYRFIMMRKVLLSVISLFAVTAVVSAFTPVVKQISTLKVIVTEVAPRDRRATIVNDGKANGKRIEIRHVWTWGTRFVLCSAPRPFGASFWWGMLVLKVDGVSGALACFNAFVRGIYSQRLDTGISCNEFLVSVLW